MTYYRMQDSITGGTVIVHALPNRLESFTEDESNTDYQAYLEWLAEGNSPEPWPPAE